MPTGSSFRRDPGPGWLRYLGRRSPRSRPRGGTSPVEASLDAAHRAGKELMTLRTTGFMDVARGMYERMGFHRDPTLDYLVDDGDLLIGYRLSLAPRSRRPDRLLALDPSMEIRELRPEEYEEAGR